MELFTTTPTVIGWMMTDMRAITVGLTIATHEILCWDQYLKVQIKVAAELELLGTFTKAQPTKSRLGFSGTP